MIARQTLAIFHDAYRELNARKLFWITLVLSGLVVAVFAMIGIHESGLTIIAWNIDTPLMNTHVMSQETFYKSAFVGLGIGFWLAWLATILALVSTAGIFPDLITSGSIDLMLAKPLSRLRLFLTKYLAGLLFVTLQVTVFSAASFIVLGLRGGTWEPAVWLAVPVVVIFFSYLFSICVLLGMLTRSTIASLLLTLLIWFVIFGLNAAETTLLVGKLAAEKSMVNLPPRITEQEAALERLKAANKSTGETVLARMQLRIDRDRDRLESRQKTVRILGAIHPYVFALKTALPKTSETIDLLERWMIDLADLPAPDLPANANVRDGDDDEEFNPEEMSAVQMQAAQTLRSRSVWWVVGTSLLFEAVVLGIAAWLFCRRDF